MDAREVRMRCLELAAARGGWEPGDVIAAAQSLENFVNSVPLGSVTTETTAKDATGTVTGSSTSVMTQTA